MSQMENAPKKNLNDVRRDLLLTEASRWVGCPEVGSDNFGQIVGLFQRLHGEVGQAWCAHFVLYCLHHTDRMFNSIFELRNNDKNLHAIFPSGSCREIWEHSPEGLRSQKAKVGHLAVWKLADGSGHIGIVKKVNGNRMETIEGNTHPDDDSNGRDGVYVRSRSAILQPTAQMRLLGFLNPWQEEFRRVVVYVGYD